MVQAGDQLDLDPVFRSAIDVSPAEFVARFTQTSLLFQWLLVALYLYQPGTWYATAELLLFASFNSYSHFAHRRIALPFVTFYTCKLFVAAAAFTIRFVVRRAKSKNAWPVRWRFHVPRLNGPFHMEPSHGRIFETARGFESSPTPMQVPHTVETAPPSLTPALLKSVSKCQDWALANIDAASSDKFICFGSLSLCRWPVWLVLPLFGVCCITRTPQVLLELSLYLITMWDVANALHASWYQRRTPNPFGDTLQFLALLVCCFYQSHRIAVAKAISLEPEFVGLAILHALVACGLKLLEFVSASGSSSSAHAKLPKTDRRS